MKWCNMRTCKYLKALAMIVLILGLMVAGQILPLAVADHLGFSENTAIIMMTILYPIIVIGGGYLLNRFLFRQRLPLVSNWHFQWWPIAYAILADMLIYLFSWIAQTGFHSSVTTMNGWWLQFVMNVISAPVVEEYTFRGYIFGAFDSIFSRTTTIWLTAFAFGLLHLSSLGHAAWYNAVLLVVSYTAMGMFFTLIAVAAHSLWASFTAHVVNNLLIYVIGIWAAVSNTPSMLWRSLTGTLLGMGITAYLIYWHFIRNENNTQLK